MLRASVTLALLVVLCLGLWALRDGPLETPNPGQGPQRIVSMAPSLTEILTYLGAGEQLVGVSAHCEGVPDGIPRVGTFQEPDFERIVDLKPDRVLVIASRAHESLHGSLQALGITVMEFSGDTLVGVREAVAEIGVLVGATERAEEFLESLDRACAAAPGPGA
ncbi:MAG: helical backbone metal receptor, partial [Planctomycetota bacterium]